jgi:hypothetical protein
MPSIRIVEHQILHKDVFAYCAHPFITCLPDGEWGCSIGRCGVSFYSVSAALHRRCFSHGNQGVEAFGDVILLA